MLGIHQLPKSATELAPATRLTRTLFALTGAAAAIFAIAGTAQAQDCVGGYRMVKGEIPVQCDSGFGASVFAPAAPIGEPLYTGSINSEQPANAARIDNSPATLSSGVECVGGYSYRETPANGWTLPMRCE
jgi:hypothetical protein